MTLDRKLQLLILERAAAAYPASLQPGEFNLDNETADIVRNIYYLHEHGLIQASFSQVIGYRVQRPLEVKATHRGLDFLADDGGLSSILGVVTIKFHEEALKAIIESKISGSELPEEEKSSLMRSVRELPGETIKQLTARLVDLGLDNMPRAIQAIQTYLS